MNLHAADALPAQYPQVERWAIGGHSLGGTMAANCAAAHPGRYSALLLLASYTNVDVSGSGMDVLSIYGDQDTVLNAANYAACRSHLPEGFTEVILPGGNHAQFGSYGMQKGDSPALITPQQQLASTVACCLKVLTGNP